MVTGKLTAGDILITRARNFSNFMHQGMVVDADGELVVHNAPDNLNSSGGTIAIERVQDYLNGRELLDVEPTGLTTEQIMQRMERLRTRQFSLTGFNCEHFIAALRGMEPASEQLTQFVRILDVVAIGPLIIYAGIKMRSPLIMAIGAGTVIYNAYNYVATDRIYASGLGDSVKNFISNATLGSVKSACSPCDKRRDWLNDKVPYRVKPLPIPTGEIHSP